MTIKSTAHYQAMKDLIELMAIASALALIADCFWIVRDMYADGMTSGRLFVMVFLDLGLGIQIYALIRFHKQLMADILHTIKTEKLKICKAKYKRGIK